MQSVKNLVFFCATIRSIWKRFVKKNVKTRIWNGLLRFVVEKQAYIWTRMVGVTTLSSQDLRIVIKRYSNSGYGKVALGYAMWHN